MNASHVAVPDFTGELVHIARDLAKKMGLDLSTDDLDGIPLTARTWPGWYRIVTQTPAPGSMAHRGDLILITFVADGETRSEVHVAPVKPPPSLSAEADEQPT